VNQRILVRLALPKLEDKPRRQRREVVYTPKEFAELLAAIPDAAFSDLLEFLWETGCRPIEARIIEHRHSISTSRSPTFRRARTKTAKPCESSS
jgi:integrase